MATSTDAARDRVLAARGELEEQLHLLEASGRAAVDIPARIKRSPAKAAAIAGGAGFLVLKGPQRLFRAARTAVRGPQPDLPDRMLPDEIEKTLRKLGKDGDKVRGVLERDFADYAKRSEKERQGLASILLLAVARPLLGRGVFADDRVDDEEDRFFTLGPCFRARRLHLRPVIAIDLKHSESVGFVALGGVLEVHLFNWSVEADPVGIEHHHQIIQAEGARETRVVRGGAWAQNDMFCRCTSRYSGLPTLAVDFIGLRLVCSPPR